MYSSSPEQGPEDANTNTAISHSNENEANSNKSIVPEPAGKKEEYKSIDLSLPPTKNTKSVDLDVPILHTNGPNNTIQTSTIEDEIIKKVKKCEARFKKTVVNWVWSLFPQWIKDRKNKTTNLVELCNNNKIDLQKLASKFYFDNVISRDSKKINPYDACVSTLVMYSLHDYNEEIKNAPKSKEFEQISKQLSIFALKKMNELVESIREKMGIRLQKEERNQKAHSSARKLALTDIKKSITQKYMGYLKETINTKDAIFFAEREYKQRTTLDKELSDQLDKLKLKKQKEL